MKELHGRLDRDENLNRKSALFGGVSISIFRFSLHYLQRKMEEEMEKKRKAKEEKVGISSIKLSCL